MSLVETLKQRMQELTRELQEDVCNALERADGQARFQEDIWTREGGGGGRTRVLENGNVFEKAGVNSSVVFGALTEAFAKRLQGEGTEFFAAGLSMVLHPQSPLVPTVHANIRFIVQGAKAWFGGGMDLTPYYLFDEDARHFHQTLKAVCDRHDRTYYQRFKAECDRYFFLRHRGEARGVGGIFFENMGGDLSREFEFVADCGRAILPAYIPIVERRRHASFTPAQRAWQEIRRGRYAEFNLIYDRGTLFGLETGGRAESILVSLPPVVRWRYDYHPLPDSDEAKLLAVLRQPKNWI